MGETAAPKELVGIGTQTFGSNTPAVDVVKGWNNRIYNTDPTQISGMVPFVQLIGLYNESEIAKLVMTDVDWNSDARSVVFVEEDGRETNLDSPWIQEENQPAGQTISTEQSDYFRDKIRSKYIGLNIRDQHQREYDVWTPGILLASNTSQVGDQPYVYADGTTMPKDSGGVGITDLQIETGTKDFMNRRYKMRITVTDPQVLNDNAEYLKLTSLQSMFLIIHGWSVSDDFINSWSNDPNTPAPTLPPTINKGDNEVWPGGTMSVDLIDKTGGIWSAATLATTMYDFAFNEVGQLEANFTFMPREISFLSTYRVSTIAENLHRFLGTGEKSSPTSPDDAVAGPTMFAGLTSGLLGAGAEFGMNLADVIALEQSAYHPDNENVSIAGLYDRLENNTEFSVSNTLRQWSEEANTYSGNILGLVEQQKHREGRYRFPYAGPGIRTYTKTTRRVRDPLALESPIERDEWEAMHADDDLEYPDDVSVVEHARGTMMQADYKTNIKYYYLGWLLEGIRFSLWDLNRNKVRRGETPFNVRFRYMDVPQDSSFQLAFQDQLKVGLIPNLESYIEEAITFLKSNCCPENEIVDMRWILSNQWQSGSFARVEHEVQGTFTSNTVYTTTTSGTLTQPKEVMRPMTEYDITDGLDAAITKEIAEEGHSAERWDSLWEGGNVLDKEGVYRNRVEDDDNVNRFFDSKLAVRLDVEQMRAVPQHYKVIGTLGDREFAPDGDWFNPNHGGSPAHGQSWRRDHIAIDAVDETGQNIVNWRNSLVIDPEADGALRIMYGPFAGQLLYSYRIPPKHDMNAGSGGRGRAWGTADDLYLSWRTGTPDSERVLGDIPYHGQGGNTWTTGPIVLDKDARASNTDGTSLVVLGQKTMEGAFQHGVEGPLVGRMDLRIEGFDEVSNGEPLVFRYQQYNTNISGGRNMLAFNNYRPMPHAAYIGDLSLTKEYGLLMPAINARLFSDEYLACQNKWYFKYINHLHNQIENIVRGRISSAIEGGELLKDIAAEPVDLFYLTGRMYWEDAPVYRTAYRPDYEGITTMEQAVGQVTGEQSKIMGVYSDWYGAGSLEAQRLWDVQIATAGRFSVDDDGVLVPGSNTGTHYDPITTKWSLPGPAAIDIGQYSDKYETTISDLREKSNDAADELQRLGGQNNQLYGSGSNATTPEWLETSELQLNSVDASESSLTQIRSSEDERAEALRGVVGAQGILNFWNSRLSRVLGELHNKNIIELPLEKIELDPVLLTDAWSITKELGGVVWSDSTSLRVIQTNARFFTNLNSYDVNYVERGRGYMHTWTKNEMFDRLDGEGGNWPAAKATIQVISRDTAGNVNNSSENTISREIVFGYDYDSYTLSLDTVNNVGYMGFSEEQLLNEEWPNGPYINYVFFNYMSTDDINNYASGDYIIGAHQWLMNRFNQARTRFADYMNTQRNLIRRYLEKINVAQAEVVKYSTSEENIINIKQEIDQQILDLEAAPANLVDRPKELSPFSPRSMLDRPVTIAKGGGRVVRLNSVVAQQWEQRFAHWEVRGVNDITNYGPTEDGVAFIDPNERYWGWDTRLNLVQNERYEELVKQQGVLASLGTWEIPHELLYLGGPEGLREKLEYYYPAQNDSGTAEDTSYNVRSAPSDIQYADPANWTNNQPNGLISHPSSEDNNAIKLHDYIKVVHLVNAGFVDLEFLRTQLFHKFGWTDIGFENGSEQKLIIGYWPMTSYVSQAYWAANATRETPINLNISGPDSSGQSADHGAEVNFEPYYLVDQDLDFVEPAYRQAISGPAAFRGDGTKEEEYLWGLNPGDLIKTNTASGYFRPTADRRRVLYPTSKGRRLGMDEHLPDLPIEAVRQLVNVNDRKPWLGLHPGRLGDAATHLAFATNPEWSGVPTYKSDDDKIPATLPGGTTKQQFEDGNINPSIAALQGVFRSDGYTAYSSEYPFGVPKEIFDNKLGAIDWPGGRSESDELEAAYAADPKSSTFNYGSYMKPRSPSEANASSYWIPADEPRSRNMASVLYQLPPGFEYGFFDSVVNANRNFGGGNPLDSSLAKFMTEHLFHLLPFGRRLMVEDYNDDHQPRGDSLNTLPARGEHSNAYGTSLMKDVTYGEIFNSFLGGKNISTADFTNQTIQNVAEIPIKREVVDSLINRNNSNMSLLQLIQQIMSPASIGLNGNIQLGVRNKNGIIEIFPASISYKNIVTDMFKEAAVAEHEGPHPVPPENQMLFNYKIKNSLIENIDMSSKMDPAAFLTYQNSSDILRGRDYNVLKMLSYEGIAEDFKEFLDGTTDVENDGQTYSGIVTVGQGREIRIDKARFKKLPATILDSFISQDPERWAKITATMQGQNNFTTELLAFYMRGVTLTIHGITNLQPFNLIHVTGVMPDLEGIYIITNLTEKITPTTFQTIIEGKLLKRKRVSDNEFI